MWAKMSNIFYKNKPIIGLDINKTGARVISIDSSGKTVTGYGSIDFDPKIVTGDQENKSTHITDQLNKMFESHVVGKLASNRVAIGIPTAQTYARTFSLPSSISQNNKITDAVNLEVEQYVPIPLNSLYVDHQIIKQDKDNITVLMCAVPRKTIDGLMDMAKSCGIEVALIEPSINSVARLIDKTNEGGAATILVDIGPVSTDIAILDSAIRVTGGINIGGNKFTLDIAKKLAVSVETAYQLKVLNGLSNGPRQESIYHAVGPSLGRILDEVKKIIRYYTDRFPNEKKPEQLLIVGSGSNMPGIGDYFTDKLVLAARVASPWQSLNFSTEKVPEKALRPRFMTAAGLALIKPSEVSE